MRLIKSEIKAATCPPGQRDTLIFDDKLSGFALRVTAKGQKTFIFQYVRGRDDKGRPKVKRLVLGKYGTQIEVDAARDLATVIAGAVAAGQDPVADRNTVLKAEAAAKAEQKRQAKVDAFTLRHLVQQWTATGLRTASAAHRREAPAAIERCFAELLDRPADSVQPAEAQAAVDVIARDRPTMARRSRDYARAMGNWGLGRALVTHNPFARVRVEGRPESRDRALSDAELGAVWRAATALPYPFGPLIRLLILTLQRRTEVAAMRWGELDADLTTWILPAKRAKNRKGHIVHLAEPARAVLRELATRPRMAGQTLVFTSTGKTPVTGFSNAIEALVRRIEREAPPAAGERAQWVDPWTLHDLRRTGVTTLARLGVAPHVADRMLNHVQGTIRGVAAVYQRHEFLADREAATRLWAAHVLAVAAAGAPAEAPPGANVVPLAGAPRRPRGRLGQ